MKKEKSIEQFLVRSVNTISITIIFYSRWNEIIHNGYVFNLYCQFMVNLSFVKTNWSSGLMNNLRDTIHNIHLQSFLIELVFFSKSTFYYIQSNSYDVELRGKWKRKQIRLFGVIESLHYQQKHKEYCLLRHNFSCFSISALQKI